MGGSPCAVCQGAKEGAKSVHTRNQSRIGVGLCTQIDENGKKKFFFFHEKEKACHPPENVNVL